MANNRILIISDLHEPYSHKDTYKFLSAVKRKIKPDKVICIGDEVDHHALSFYDSDADLPSAGYELEMAIERLSNLYRLFPCVDVVDSNHGSMSVRRAKVHGIPMKYLRAIGDVLEAPDGWKWHKELIIKLPNKQSLLVHHGLKKNGLKVAQQMGMNVVQGHYHTEFNISYSSSPSQLIWSMMVGCLINDTALSFAYNRTNLGRPIIGCGAIIEGQPKLIPMILDKNGTWIEEIL
jgi:predicted phosphodiesterase